MAWLIENVLEEDMKTAADFEKKKEEEKDKEAREADKSIARDEKRDAKSYNYRDIDNKYDNLRKSKNAQYDALGAVIMGTDSKKHTDDALKYGKAAASVIDKVDAIDRHNRRHPDKKVVNAAAEIELLQ